MTQTKGVTTGHDQKRIFEERIYGIIQTKQFSPAEGTVQKLCEKRGKNVCSFFSLTLPKTLGCDINAFLSA